ncbi:MAG: hemolysin family protein, partial [Verrucomicrobiota bacterium]
MDWGLIILKIFAVALLVLVNGFFVAAEFALVKIRETQLDTLVAKNHRRAKIARWVINNLDTSLSAAQLGITVASLMLGWIGEPVFADLLQPVFRWLHLSSATVQHWISFVVGLSTITFLHIVVGEQAPKWLAIQKPLETSLWVAQPLVWFRKISYPFIWLLNQSSIWVLRRLGIEPVGETEMVHSVEELRLLFASSHKHSGGTNLGRDIVLNALDLRNRSVRDVMRPRQEITFFNTESSVAECREAADKTRYSRYPLCEKGDLDKTLGVIHIKDLYAMRSRIENAAQLQSVARKLIYVPETARLEKVLQLFLERKLHLAIVVDEYGGTVGMITLENILEELVGQIQDEFDQEKPLLKKQGDDTWEIAGALPLHDLSDLVGEPLQEEGITTTSGWVTHQLGGFPKKGDRVPLGN